MQTLLRVKIKWEQIQVSSRKVKIRLLVKEVAESRGVNRAILARRADLTYETIHLIWRNPYKDVSLSTLAKIAHALKVNVADLYVIEDNTIE